MSHLRSSARRPRPRSSSIAAAVAFVMLAPAAPAVAADAPARTVGWTASGAPTTDFVAHGVSNDGTEVVGNIGGDIVSRNVAAGTTTVLLSGDLLLIQSVSDDLRFIVARTAANNVIPGDTDGQPDLFLLDRASGSVTKVSRELRGMLDGTRPDSWSHDEVQQSRDGRFVTYRLSSVRNATATRPERKEFSLWRFDRTTSYNLRLRTLAEAPAGTDVRPTDVAGSVVVSGAAAYVGKRTIPLPLPLPSTPGASPGGQVGVSPGGRTIAVHPYADYTKLSLLSVATGEVTATMTVPPELTLNGFWIVDVADDASGVLIRTRVRRTGEVQRDVILRVDRSGAISQVGSDVLALVDTPRIVLSPNRAWASNGYVLSSLSGLPLPGSEPPRPELPLMTWLTYRDVTCARNFFGQVSWIRASVTLARVPQNVDTRTPASATVKVFKTTAPSTIYNQFTTTAGAERPVTVPNTGGWSYSATVTFTDGSTSAGTVDVPAHAAPRC